MTESAEPDFEVIVISAGVAGCVTAYQLARQGRSVLLIERGEAPGSKNLSGGVLYSRGMQQVFPDFLSEAPVERRITRNYINFINADSSVAIDYKDARLSNPVNAVTVLRAKLDPWLAAKCEEARRPHHARHPRRPGADRGRPGRPAGHRRQAGDDELRARVVVAADGVNSFIAKEAGLRRNEPLNHLAVGAKSVVSLPRETIEARFNLTGDEGAAIAPAVGDCTQGLGGGGFLYTNIDSLSVGIVVRLDDLTAKKKVVTDVFDHFVEHRFIAPYLDGGELLGGFRLHLVAEGGMHMIGEITMDGMLVVGDAAGLTLNTGLTVRGMDLAVGSAVAAAEAIGSALQRQGHLQGGTGRVPGAAVRLLRRPGHEDLRQGPVLPRGGADVQAVRRAVRQRPVRRVQPGHQAAPAYGEGGPQVAGPVPAEDAAAHQGRHRRSAVPMKKLSVTERLTRTTSTSMRKSPTSRLTRRSPRPQEPVRPWSPAARPTSTPRNPTGPSRSSTPPAWSAAPAWPSPPPAPSLTSKPSVGKLGPKERFNFRVADYSPIGLSDVQQKPFLRICSPGVRRIPLYKRTSGDSGTPLLRCANHTSAESL